PQLGELDEYLCSCGQHIKQCQFWRDVSERMAKQGIPNFDIGHAELSIHDAKSPFLRRVLKPLPRGPLLEVVRGTALAVNPEWPGHLRNVHQRNVALVHVLQEITGAKVVVDSSKIAVHLRYLLKSPELKIKIIRLIRDGRAVATSMMRHGLKRDTREATV